MTLLSLNMRFIRVRIARLPNQDRREEANDVAISAQMSPRLRGSEKENFHGCACPRCPSSAKLFFVSFACFAVKNPRMSEHRIGIIGGTGLYNIEGFTNQKWVKVKTPFGPPSDDLLTGKLAGRDVVFLPRHGRGHRILPSELNHRANIWAMKKLGVAWIISVSAVGSLQEKYKPCDIVLVDQFLDRTKRSSEHTFFGRGIVAHIAFAHPICEELRQILLKAGGRVASPTCHRDSRARPPKRSTTAALT